MKDNNAMRGAVNNYPASLLGLSSGLFVGGLSLFSLVLFLWITLRMIADVAEDPESEWSQMVTSVPMIVRLTSAIASSCSGIVGGILWLNNRHRQAMLFTIIWVVGLIVLMFDWPAK